MITTTEIERTNRLALMMADRDYGKLKTRRHVPYLNSFVLIEGMLNSALAIMRSEDKDEWTTDLTPFRRAVFVQAYLEIINGLIEHVCEDKPDGNRINVPK